MIRFFLIFLCIGFLGCNQSENKKQEIDKIEFESVDTMGMVLSGRKSWNYDWGFEEEDGSFLKYICRGENMFIEYGNLNFRKVLKDTFLCGDLYVGIPRIWWNNEDFICLRYGCGSPCWGSIILPLNEKDTIEEYMYQYEFDGKRNIIIYLNYEEERDQPFLIARNLESNRTEEISFESCFNAGFMGYCIDSISFENGLLYLQTLNDDELKKGINSTGYNIIRKRIKI